MIPDARLATWPGPTAPLSRVTKSTCKLCAIPATFMFRSRSCFSLVLIIRVLLYLLTPSKFCVWLSYVMCDTVRVSLKGQMLNPEVSITWLLFLITWRIVCVDTTWCWLSSRTSYLSVPWATPISKSEWSCGAAKGSANVRITRWKTSNPNGG